jgi:hypothetical protein
MDAVGVEEDLRLVNAISWQSDDESVSPTATAPSYWPKEHIGAWGSACRKGHGRPSWQLTHILTRANGCLVMVDKDMKVSRGSGMNWASAKCPQTWQWHDVYSPGKEDEGAWPAGGME